ncbi:MULTISPECIES: hypothetical protein [unclassified Phycicoccus]|uniref:hypothetical protein n=1 Tax=unclassified Phycicoccus TaxID=2637926 RepID=UPI000A92E76F|nr:MULTISPECIES: hypothetical protein [unclassified Phycicoccus]
MFTPTSPEMLMLMFLAGALLVVLGAVGVLVRTAAAAPRGVVVPGRFDSRTSR